MTVNFCPGQRARTPFGLSIVFALCFFALPAAAAGGDIWRSSFGQGWFYEVRSSANEVVAGTWWESALSPGTTYTISFDVKKLRGRLGLLVGDNGVVGIDRSGTYSYDFHISPGGKRRMIFRSLSADFMASVTRISVRASTGGARYSAGGSKLPTGHYLSLDRERNLRTEMQNLLDRPGTAPSNYHLRIARDLDAALKTPGVKGVWMEFDWRSLEPADGRFAWQVLDANMDIARKRGLKFVVKVADRSFNGRNPLPACFPSKYVLWSSGGGKSGVVAKRWDPYVYNRLIRLYRAIARRYATHSGFGGIATAETATGNFKGGNYSLAAYRQALTQIATRTEAALTNGKLFFYMNFLKGGDNSDMNRDARVALLRQLPHGDLVVGGPDITPDVQGMPRSATAYRVHVRRTMPGVEQFCHMQHVDQGLGGTNVKSNRYRREYLQEVRTVREHEKQWWFKGKPAVFAFDDLRHSNTSPVNLHPQWELGKLWQPDELFRFGRRNFGCDYVFWHYREHAGWNEFGWPDVRPVILNHQYL